MKKLERAQAGAKLVNGYWFFGEPYKVQTEKARSEVYRIAYYEHRQGTFLPLLKGHGEGILFFYRRQDAIQVAKEIAVYQMARVYSNQEAIAIWDSARQS